MPTRDPGQVRAATSLCSRREGQIWIEEAVVPRDFRQREGLRERCHSLIFGVAPAVRAPASVSALCPFLPQGAERGQGGPLAMPG